MSTFKLILREAGLSGLKWWQVLILLWFSLSLFGLTMNGDAPAPAWAAVWSSLAVSGLCIKKFIPFKGNES